MIEKINGYTIYLKKHVFLAQSNGNRNMNGTQKPINPNPAIIKLLLIKKLI